MKPIRVLHVNINMNRGGIETFIMNIYRHIDRNKIQFDFLLHTKNKCDYEDEIKNLGGRIYRINNPMKNSLPSFLRMISYRIELSDFFKKHKYRIVHSHMSARSADVLMMAKKAGIQTRIAHSHTVSNYTNFLRKIFYFLKSFQVQSAATDFFACSSKAALSLFGKKLVKKRKVKIIYNAIDICKFQYNQIKRDEIRKKYHLEDKKVIGNIASFTYPKNHSFIIDIFYEINKKRDDCILMLIGEGNLKKRIEKKVNSLKIESKVLFLGMRKDVNHLIQAMDIFLFPSLYEGFGIVLIEAQTAGLPCLVSNRIPDEALVSHNIKKVSLKKGSKFWADVLRYYLYKNKRMYEENKEISRLFNARNIASFLCNFYLSC